MSFSIYFYLITGFKSGKRITFEEVDKKKTEYKIYFKIKIKKFLLFFQMLFTNLTVNQEYLLKVQALTSSLYQENLIYPGTVSEVLLGILEEKNFKFEMKTKLCFNLLYRLFLLLFSP